MKKLCLIGALILLVISYGRVTAQPPVYVLSIDYQLPLPGDTLSYMMLYDINGDSVKEMFYSYGRYLYIYNLVSGLPVMDSIEYESEFVYTIHYSIEDSATYVYSAEYIGGITDTIILKVVSFPLNDPSNRDSLYIDAGWDHAGSCWEGFWHLSSILVFDIESDGTSDIVVSWGCRYSCEINHLELYGYMLASDLYGNLVVDVTSAYNTLECDKFLFSGRWYYLAWMDFYGYIAFHGDVWIWEHGSIRAYDDMLRRINSKGVSYDWANFKLLKGTSGYFAGILLISNSLVYKYSAPFFFEESWHNMPAKASACYFRYDNTLYILTGTYRSYFELRDMDLNLLAFIWGPHMDIFDVDAVDIDPDGTDELLCETDSGFVLYRLNTATAVAEGESILPSEFGIAAYPNPFNSQVNLAISGFENGITDISIYDIGGRLVRSYSSVSGTIRWNGNDYTGAALSSGVYFVTARSSDIFASTKVLLLR